MKVNKLILRKLQDKTQSANTQTFAGKSNNTANNYLQCTTACLDYFIVLFSGRLLKSLWWQTTAILISSNKLPTTNVKSFRKIPLSRIKDIFPTDHLTLVHQFGFGERYSIIWQCHIVLNKLCYAKNKRNVRIATFMIV